MKKLIEAILCGANIVNTLGLLATLTAAMFNGGFDDTHIKFMVIFGVAIAVGIIAIVVLYAVFGEVAEATKVITRYNK